jgi:nucleoporin NUP159
MLLQSIEMGINICLTVGTKKEEVARFNKAKTDPEFAKMLKVRTLGPEYLETQSQLRRDIRVCNNHPHSDFYP